MRNRFVWAGFATLFIHLLIVAFLFFLFRNPTFQPVLTQTTSSNFPTKDALAFYLLPITPKEKLPLPKPSNSIQNSLSKSEKNNLFPPKTAPSFDTTPPSSTIEKAIPPQSPHYLSNGLSSTSLSLPMPSYPPLALKNQIEASVSVKIFILPNGEVEHMEWIGEKAPEIFCQAVERSVKQWRLPPSEEKTIRFLEKEFLFKIKKE